MAIPPELPLRSRREGVGGGAAPVARRGVRRQRLHRPPHRPADEGFLPRPYDGSKKAVRRLLDQVCEYMDVVPDLVALKFVSDAGKIWMVNESGQYLPGA